MKTYGRIMNLQRKLLIDMETKTIEKESERKNYWLLWMILGVAKKSVFEGICGQNSSWARGG